MDEDVGEIGVTEKVKPLFFLNNEVDQEDGNVLNCFGADRFFRKVD